MNRTTQIRDALAAGPLAFRKLHEQIGGDDVRLRQTLYAMTHAGEVKVGDDEDKTVKLLRTPPQGKRKKPAGNKGKHMKRPYKKLIERVAARKPNGADIGTLALANYLGAGALLRQAIEDGVEDLSECHGLRNAITNHERAEQILNAARAA